MGKNQKISVKILSSEDELFIGETDCLFVPSKKGEVAILPYHVPMVLLMTKGAVSIVENRKKKKITEVEKGIVRVDDNSVSVLVNL